MLKKIFAVLAIALLLGGTAFAYSYWDNLSQSESETISIGQGVTLEVEASVSAPEGKFLVPEGSVLKENDVTEVELTYNVSLDQEALEALNLSVTASNIQIGGSSTNQDLVNIDIQQASATVNSSDVLVTITVTIDEPATYEIYTDIYNQDITFTLTFEGTQN